MQAAVAGEKTKKFYLYSGHDNTGELSSVSCVRRELVFFLNNLVCLCKTEVTKEKLTSWSHSCDSWNGFPPCCCLQRLKARSQILAFRCASKLAPNCLLQFPVGWGAGGCAWLKLKRDICDLRSYGVNCVLANFMAVPMVSVTVMPLLVALNASDHKWCPYASMIQLELLEVLNPTNTDYAVRLLFNGEERHIKSYCDASPCSLAQFMQFIRDNTPEDPVKDCHVTNHDVMFRPRPPIFSRAHALFWFETESNAWITEWFWISNGRVHQSSFTDLVLLRWSLSENSTKIFLEILKVVLTQEQTSFNVTFTNEFKTIGAILCVYVYFQI